MAKDDEFTVELARMIKYAPPYALITALACRGATFRPVGDNEVKITMRLPNPGQPPKQKKSRRRKSPPLDPLTEY